ALRFCQGLALGGEWSGAALLATETAKPGRRATAGIWPQLGAPLGYLLATTIFLILFTWLGQSTAGADGTGPFLTWGWRIPFLLALPLGVLGLVLRSRMPETPVFAECVACDAIKGSAWDRLVDLLTNYTRPILVTFALLVALNIIDYTLVTYQPTYLHASAGLDERSRTAVVLVGELAMMACIPFAGAWSDRIGRKPLWRGSLIGFIVLALPMYWLMGQGFACALVGFTVLSVLFAAPLATVAATFPAMFPTQVRYAGFAIADNAAVAVFGGTAPVLADSVIEHTGWQLFPAAYLVAAAVLGLVALRFLPETLGCSLR
ncbi:MFS transporter, partial [[Mycobacterium] nativiensis]